MEPALARFTAQPGGDLRRRIGYQFGSHMEVLEFQEHTHRGQQLAGSRAQRRNAK
jgi:hypothetical protein